MDSLLLEFGEVYKADNCSLYSDTFFCNMGHNDKMAVARHMLHLPNDIIHRCLITCRTVLMVMYTPNVQTG